MYGVAVSKLTQTLFLINPRAFLPVDPQSLLPLCPKLYGVRDWETYVRELKTVYGTFPGCEPYEIQHFAYAVFGRRELDGKNAVVWQTTGQIEGRRGTDHWPDFRENGCVYLREPHPDLHKPVPGDVVVVRSGIYDGCGIGVVHRNDHGKTWTPEQRLHVLWVNTVGAPLSEITAGKLFSRGDAVMEKFRNAPAYAPTLELLKNAGWNFGDPKPAPSPQPGPPPSPAGPLSRDLKPLAQRLLVSVEELQEIVDLLRDKNQVIFQGPPGTGKTYLARELAEHLAGRAKRVRLVQFHPSYAYEDFVQGFRPTLKGGHARFTLRNGPLIKMAKRAERAPDEGHFLIIDEINRGNLSKTLGELYFLLEYRGAEMRLQYSNKTFSLPPNLYIIGTMNTADRSIARVDLALRRRFYFKEFHPDKPPINELLRKWLKEHKLEEFLELERVLQEANKELADRHASIGPTYFMPKDRKLDDKRVRRIWRHNVMPYIEERLFDQEDRLEEFKLDRLRKRVKGQSPSTDEAQEDASEEAESNNDGD